MATQPAPGARVVGTDPGATGVWRGAWQAWQDAREGRLSVPQAPQVHRSPARSSRLGFATRRCATSPKTPSTDAITSSPAMYGTSGSSRERDAAELEPATRAHHGHVHAGRRAVPLPVLAPGVAVVGEDGGREEDHEEQGGRERGHEGGQGAANRRRGSAHARVVRRGGARGHPPMVPGPRAPASSARGEVPQRREQPVDVGPRGEVVHDAGSQPGSGPAVGSWTASRRLTPRGACWSRSWWPSSWGQGPSAMPVGTWRKQTTDSSGGSTARS